MSDTFSIANLLNEIGMLFFIPRSGFAFLGSGQQSVAEHSFRVALVAYALTHLQTETVDLHKLIMMCLFHDLPEARTGDLNYVQKKYVVPQLDKVLQEIHSSYSLGPEIVGWIQEYKRGESLEARLAHDADQLELLLCLKREEELGHTRAKEWIVNLLKRLQTSTGQRLAEAICQTSVDAWWWKNKEDLHWVDGGKRKRTSLLKEKGNSKNGDHLLDV